MTQIFCLSMSIIYNLYNVYVPFFAFVDFRNIKNASLIERRTIQLKEMTRGQRTNPMFSHKV